MQKIVPNFWMDSQAEEASSFYTQLFPNSKVIMTTRYTEVGKEIHGHIPGSVLTVEFEIFGYRMLLLNGGNTYKINPSISMFIRCEDEPEVDRYYMSLSEGGSVLMPLQAYPFSKKYAWVVDRFGISWQIYLGDTHLQKVTPCLMFVREQAGHAEEAMNHYVSVFPNSRIGQITRYPAGANPDVEGSVMHSSFWLFNEEFMAMDSRQNHQFGFTHGVSLAVNCDTQAELDEYWGKMSADPKEEQCGWMKDKFGVSWQIVPVNINDYLFGPDQVQANKAMAALFEMKKLDIQALKDAYNS